MYGYVRSGTTWTEEVRLVDGDAETGWYLGYFTSLDGDTVVSSAPAEQELVPHVYVHSLTDIDDDGRYDYCDNCPDVPNAQRLGIC